MAATWRIGSSQLSVEGSATGRLEILSRSLLSHSNLSLHFVRSVILKQFRLSKPCVLPEAQWSICKGYYLISIYINESWTFLHTNSVLIIFLFYIFISFKDSYTLTQTHTYNAGLHPFGIPWITVLLWRSVPLKI